MLNRFIIIRLNRFIINTPTILYSIDLQNSSYQSVFTIKVENSVDPDQLASQKPADQYLHCFQNKIYLCSTWKGLNSTD